MAVNLTLILVGGGATDHSVVNDEGHPLHYYSEEEHNRLLDLFDDED